MKVAFLWFSGFQNTAKTSGGSKCLMFLGGLKQCDFDSRLAFKGKVDSRDLRSRRHDFGGSTRAKIMKFHDCKMYYNSLQKLIILCFGRVILEVSGLISIVFTADVCKKMIF